MHTGFKRNILFQETRFDYNSNSLFLGQSKILENDCLYQRPIVKPLKTKTKVYLVRASTTTYEGGQIFSLSLNSFAHDLNLGIFLELVKQQKV